MADSSSNTFINLQQSSYRRFRSILRERTRPVVLWCGSGLSIPVGLPDWQELKIRLLDDLEGKAMSFPDSSSSRSKLLKKGVTIEAQENAWIAFSMLEKALGQSTFRESIREHLNLPHALEVPIQYLGFWNAGIRGVINLNLDRMATRAYAETKHANLIEVAGKNIKSAPNVIGSGKDFVLNLHGTTEDADSWVLTYERLKELQDQGAYKTTLSGIFTNFAIIFAGISADDIGAGGFLEAITKEGIDLGPHFWMTSRTDEATDRWAEGAGLQVIRYVAKGDHQVAFFTMFDDLKAFVPEEETPPAVKTTLVEPDEKIPPPEELAGNTPEEIRKVVASHARYILENSDNPIPESYRLFSKEYARSIYNSWYVSTDQSDNRFFGYQVCELLGEGAFSKVYKGLTPNGNDCAIKIMHQNLAGDDVLLSCFRRGINSMRILEAHEVAGMIRLMNAVELPAAIFMEFVDGPTLEVAIESRSLEPWEDGIDLLISVAKIIRGGHQLPERVLHRDLRPSNIMLRNFYNPNEITEVVVLDFDLSWHRGAYDVTLTQHAHAALGYLAPEQVNRDTKVSTRNAAVDTYGLCATIYFVFTGEHPQQGVFRSVDFLQYFRRKTASYTNTTVNSVGNRLRRLVSAGVSWNQAERPDFGEIEQELSLLSQAIHNLSGVESPDFWAEEILCRARGEENYEYEKNGGKYIAELASGMNISTTPDFASRSIQLVIAYADPGDRDRKNVVKFLKERIKEAISSLESVGFNFEKGADQMWHRSYSMQATIGVEVLCEKSEEIGAILERAIERLAVQ